LLRAGRGSEQRTDLTAARRDMGDGNLCMCAFSTRQLPEEARPISAASCGIGMAYHHLDSLPYYDSDLTTFPFLRDRALDEITRELGTVPTQLHPGVPPDVELFEVRSVRDWGRDADMRLEPSDAQS